MKLDKDVIIGIVILITAISGCILMYNMEDEQIREDRMAGFYRQQIDGHDYIVKKSNVYGADNIIHNPECLKCK